ncbi:MAG: hemerythrin domain-containing protein [Chlorobi bacterium]|nr:hemerythrin domain-containing protein [Chlorobiota bacterium]
MENLTKTLKEEHKQIAETLNHVVNIGIGSHEGQEELLKAKNMLLQHLKKEDTFLYPRLREAAKDNEKIQHVLDSFAKDMDEISNAALKFFEKYEGGGEGIEFAKDFGHLFSALSLRIRREETHLYKIYEQLTH